MPFFLRKDIVRIVAENYPCYSTIDNHHSQTRMRLYYANRLSGMSYAS